MQRSVQDSPILSKQPQLPRSKRLRFSIYTLHLLTAVGVLGMYLKTDLSQLAAYMAVTVIPLVAYIIGDTMRPSNLNDIEK